jgi:hypothetical protein
MPNPLFDFFEVLADELSVDPSRVITRDELGARDKESLVLENLKRFLKAGTSEDAMETATQVLREHFLGKSADLPFGYDPVTGRFSAIDREFLTFVKEMSSIRSLGKRARDFECNVATWLGKRVKGAVHRVGHPRNKKKRKKLFNEHLRMLGFDRPVALGWDKDGGLDVLWLVPLGTLPHRPIVSVQCKNGEFKIEVADASLGPGSRSFSQHSGLQTTIHVPCVLFNDYVYPSRLPKKQMNFVPLGLSDLAAIQDTATSVELL